MTSYLLIFEKIWFNSHHIFDQFICYMGQVKLFHDDCYFIRIFPNRSKNIAIAEQKRESLNIRRAVYSLVSYIPNIMAKNNKENMDEFSVRVELDVIKNKLDKLLDNFIHFPKTKET